MSEDIEPSVPITPGQEAAARAAFETEQEIIRIKTQIQQGWVELASHLYRFHDLNMWKDLGYQSFEEWLATPSVDLSRRHIFGLIQAWKDLVIGKGVEPGELAGFRVSKVLNVLPAVRRGQVDVEEALSDVRNLSRDDLREKYENAPATSGPDTGTTYNADHTPEYAICPACGSRYRVAG